MLRGNSAARARGREIDGVEWIEGERAAARVGRLVRAPVAPPWITVAALIVLGACSSGGSGSTPNPGPTGGDGGGDVGGDPGGGGGDGGGDTGGGQVVESTPNPTIEALVALGETVGEFELAAPDVTPFILHATLPVPRRTHVSGADVPFKLVDSAGTVSLAQVETVTRYPDPADGADVVEIVARVARPAGTAPGTRIHYSVLYDRHAPASIAETPNVHSLVTTPDALVLRTRDAFDHEYTADLLADLRSGNGSLRSLKRGRLEAQVATHEVLRPVNPTSGAQGTLAHMMGVHTYLTRFDAEDFVSLDLRVHDGFSGLDVTTTDDDPIGKVYFRSLELVVPAGWTLFNAFDDPYFGTPYDENGARVYPIVRPIDGNPAGPLHMMPRMSQFHRRFALAYTGGEARAQSCLREQGLGFARSGTNAQGHAYFSWWNHDTGRWFSQRQTLPSLLPATESSVRDTLAWQLSLVVQQTAAGTAGSFPVETANLGWAHPWGISQGGMVSGSEIYIYDGVDVAYAASNEGYRLHELTHRMYSDRQPNVLFNVDGTFTRDDQWTRNGPNGPYMPIWWYNAPMLWAADPFGYNSAPTFQIDAVEAAGRQPWYEWELAGFEPIDSQHLVRYTRSAKVLVWLGNDALAKEDVVAQAEGFRLGYSELPQDQWGSTISTGMRGMQNYVAAYPGTGLHYGRGESWGLDANLVLYSLASEVARERMRPWFHAILEMLETGQSDCTGIIQATPGYNTFGGIYRTRQSIEAAIMENALVGLRETVLLGPDADRTHRLDAVLRRAFYAMISPLVWSTENHGPWAMMAVGPFQMEEPPFCTYLPDDGHYPYADHFQIWSSFAYAWELTHDQTFLDKAAEGLGTTNLAATLMSNPLDNWVNKSALLALVQQMAASTE